MLLWHGEEVDEQRAVTLSLALCDREVARASARASAGARHCDCVVYSGARQ